MELPSLNESNQFMLPHPIIRMFETSIGRVTGMFVLGKHPEIEALLNNLPSEHPIIDYTDAVTISGHRIRIDRDDDFVRGDVEDLLRFLNVTINRTSILLVEDNIRQGINNKTIAVESIKQVEHVGTLHPKWFGNSWFAIYYRGRIDENANPEIIGYYQGYLFRDERDLVYSNNSYIHIYPPFRGEQLRFRFNNETKSLCTSFATFAYSCLRQIGANYIVIYDIAGIGGCLCYMRSAEAVGFTDRYYTKEPDTKLHSTTQDMCVETSGKDRPYFILALPGLFKDNYDVLGEWLAESEEERRVVELSMNL